MAKGLCCAAQAAGDLGKPLIVTVRRRDGTTFQRCGVCEVRPSCSNPQKLVFAFRFLKRLVCGLPGGATKCGPTAQGVAQYQSQIPVAAAGGQFTAFGPDIRETPQFEFPPTMIPGGVPYQLP